NKGLQFDRVGRTALDVLIDLHCLPPAAILAAQPERDAGGVQVMPGCVEVDGPQFLCCDRTDAEVAARKLAGEPTHVAFAQIDLELQFLHEPSPGQCFFSFPRHISVRENQSYKRMTAWLSSPARPKCKGLQQCTGWRLWCSIYRQRSNRQVALP